MIQSLYVTVWDVGAPGGLRNSLFMDLMEGRLPWAALWNVECTFIDLNLGFFEVWNLHFLKFHEKIGIEKVNVYNEKLALTSKISQTANFP